MRQIYDMKAANVLRTFTIRRELFGAEIAALIPVDPRQSLRKIEHMGNSSKTKHPVETSRRIQQGHWMCIQEILRRLLLKGHVVISQKGKRNTGQDAKYKCLAQFCRQCGTPYKRGEHREPDRTRYFCQECADFYTRYKETIHGNTAGIGPPPEGGTGG